MKKIVFILAILFFLSCEKKVEKFKPSISLEEIIKDEKRKKIIWDFRLKYNGINRAKSKNEELEILYNHLTEKELIQITECDVTLMRCIAFKRLVETNYIGIRKILYKHKNDNDIVREYYYDVVFETPAKLCMLNQLEPFSKSKYRFSKKEFEKIKNDFLK